MFFRKAKKIKELEVQLQYVRGRRDKFSYSYTTLCEKHRGLKKEVQNKDKTIGGLKQRLKKHKDAYRLYKLAVVRGKELNRELCQARNSLRHYQRVLAEFSLKVGSQRDKIDGVLKK